MDDLKSKSQKKRDAESLKHIGVELVALSRDKLDMLPLSDALKRAILEAKAMKSHGALKRQTQLIGKLMRSADYDALLEAYAGLQAEDSAQTARFHAIEQWRMRLIEEGRDALTELIEHYPSIEVQPLRQLIKKAVEEKSKEKHTGASKALFRFLRSFL
jgi:ribosome-associated protein